MDKRKETFNPEKINFVAVIDSLNWRGEVTPVDLVKAVNNVEGLRGRKRYETNEKSFSLLIKYFEKKVGDLVTVRINGKDRFYTLKPEYRPEQLVHYARTGEILEIKEELKKEDPKFYVPEVKVEVKEVKTRKAKRVFPDSEVMAKSIILMTLLRDNEGKVESRIFNEIREKLLWKYQRSIEGKPYTAYLEVNRFCKELLDLKEDPIVMDKKDNLYKWKVDLTILDSKIKDTISLMDDEDMKKKVLEITKKLESVKKTDDKAEEVKPISEEKKPRIVTPKPIERPRIIKTSPEVGKSEFKEMGSTPVTVYEGSKTRWYKHLIGQALKGSERGVWYNFSDISSIIKKTRFTEIGTREIKDLCGEIGKQFKGIFRELDFGGLTIGSETLVKDLIGAYPAEKITETIFIRLKMDINEIRETYPELNVKVASEISEKDNVYEFLVDRTEKTEKAFAKLVFKMRHGEAILESPSCWTVKRARILIDKLQNF